MNKYTFVHTQCLDGELERTKVEAKGGLSKEYAIGCFRKAVQSLTDELMDNEYLNGKIYIRMFKAVVKIEGVHHVVAITKEG